jgi:hypothetical protein
MQGENFMQALNAACPTIPEEGTEANLIAASQRHAGYEKCMEMILFFIQPPPVDAAIDDSLNYPDLDDDSKWTDAQKRAAEAQTS